MTTRGILNRIILSVVYALLCCEIGIAGPSIEEKLKIETDFLPTASTPVERLIEVARRFKIPMAIEWLDTADAEQASEIRLAKRTVAELVRQILSGSDQYVVQIEDGLLHIYCPGIASHPFNFLNIQLNDFEVNDGDLFEAQDQLRWAIRFTLEPQKYENGYGGGYGHGANHVFEIPKFSIHASNLTVRQALNRIAHAQGNALWVATIKKSQLDQSKPYWQKQGADGGSLPVTLGWHFLPLSDLSELATERIVVDLSIEDFGEMRVTKLPVLMDQGFIGGSGGGYGGTSSSGISYSYHADVKKVNKDFVTLVVYLTVSRDGRQILKLEQPVDVFRGRVTELRPDSLVTLKASIESNTQP
jgi:hypothetical protein